MSRSGVALHVLLLDLLDLLDGWDGWDGWDGPDEAGSQGDKQTHIWLQWNHMES